MHTHTWLNSKPEPNGVTPGGVTQDAHWFVLNQVVLWFVYLLNVLEMLPHDQCCT